MKTSEQVKPNYGPVYAAALYPEWAKIFVDHGYALAVHGSLARDFDLVGIPWADTPDTPDQILAEITSKFNVKLLGVPEVRAHGRLVQKVTIGFGECAVDLSFMPVVTV